MDENVIKRLDVHRKELDCMQEGVKECQITIAQHGERLNAEAENMKRQNGLLEELSHGINTVNKKLDALTLSGANRINELARTFTKQAADIERSSLERDAATNLVTKEDIETLRVDFLKQHTEAQSTLQWKIIAALSSIAFLFILVFISYSFHVFGGLP